MNNPFFSICMPTFNREFYLKDAIDSVIKQTFADFEFLILDDCSTDNSINLIKSYKDKRIKTIFLNNKESVSVCRNILIDKAKGKYILFIDSDDYFTSENSLNTISMNMSSDIETMLCFGFNDFFVDRNCLKKTNLINFLNQTHHYIENPFYDFANNKFGSALWNKVYSNSIIKEYNIRFPNNIEIGEDYVFNLLYCLNIKKVITLNDSLYTRRIHSDSLFESKNDFEYRYKNWISQNIYFYNCSFKSKNKQSTEMLAYLTFHRYSKVIRRHYFASFALFNSKFNDELKDKIKKCYKKTPLDRFDIIFAKSYFYWFYRIFVFPFAFIFAKFCK